MTRLAVSGMPGVESERTLVMGREDRREAIYRDGIFIGDVVYVARRRRARGHEVEVSSTGFCTDYGWRPDGWHYSPNLKLTDKAGAIARLYPVVEEARP